MIFSFLWDGKPPKIKNNVITNTFENGGIQFPNIDLLVKAQKVSWVKRMLENCNAAWMQLLYTVLPSINIKHLLKCLIDPNDLSNDIPNFYRQILYAWYQLSELPASGLDIRRQIIWYNKYIKIDEKCIFYKQFYNKGIYCINDILNENGALLTHQQCSSKYDLHIDTLKYLGIISAIPKPWRKLLKECNFRLDTINNNEDPHIKINDQYKNIKLIKSKEIYLKLLKQKETTPPCIIAWNSRLNLNLSAKEWSYIFTLPKHTVCDTKVLEMQLKILHRFYATNSIISKWDSTKSENCATCNQKANILHMFVLCPVVQNFWQSFEVFLETYSIEHPQSLTSDNIIFGLFKQVKYDMLNHAIMFAKYFIHIQHIANRHLFINNFINYYKYIILIERQRYAEKREQHVFTSRFGKSKLYVKL